MYCDRDSCEWARTDSNNVGICLKLNCPYAVRIAGERPNVAKMSAAQKREYLDQYIARGRTIIRLEAELERWRSSASNLSQGIRGAPARSGVSDPVARSVESIIGLENKLSIELREAVETRKHIKKLIDNIKRPEFREALASHYIDGKTWETIADEMHVEPRTIYRWAQAGIDQIK